MKILFAYSLVAVAIGLSCQPPSLTLNAIVGILSSLFFAYVLKKYPITIKLGLYFGFILTLVQFHWVASVFRLFTGNSLSISIAFAITMYLIASIQFGLFALFYNKMKYFTWLSPPLYLPIAWTVAELIYPKFIPWSQGAPMIALTPLIGISSLGGPPLVSFVLLWVCSLLISLKSSERLRFENLFIITAILGSSWTYSSHRTNSILLEEQSSKKINIALVQPNLDPNKDFDFEALPRRSKLLKDLTKKSYLGSDAKLDLIIWPESSVGYTFYPEEIRLEDTDPRHPLNDLEVPLIFGGQVQLGKVYSEDTKFHNAALALFPEGKLIHSYYKEVLFPFSEETPLASIFPKLEEKFKPISNYQKGEIANSNPLIISPANIGLRICFEDIWPNLFRKNVLENNSNLLVSLSNDGWFSRTAAMYQHHLLALWRAVENNRYLVRAGNNGISELVSPSGKVVKSLKAEEIASTIFNDVPLLESKSIFTTYGLLAFLVITTLLILTDISLRVLLRRWRR